MTELALLVSQIIKAIIAVAKANGVSPQVLIPQIQLELEATLAAEKAAESTEAAGYAKKPVDKKP